MAVILGLQWGQYGSDNNRDLFMRLRGSKLREKELYYSGRCCFCLPKVGGVSSLLLPLSNLNSRYYQPQIQSNHFRKASQLLKGSPPFIQNQQAVSIALWHKLTKTVVKSSSSTGITTSRIRLGVLVRWSKTGWEGTGWLLFISLGIFLLFLAGTIGITEN